MKLGELILKRKRDLRLSYGKMSRKAEAAGYPVSPSAIHKLATDDKPDRRVEQNTLHGLAAALDTSFAEVILCWLDTLGVQLSSDVVQRPDVRGYVTLTEGLSEDDRERALSVLRSAIAMREGFADQVKDDPEGTFRVVRPLEAGERASDARAPFGLRDQELRSYHRARR